VTHCGRFVIAALLLAAPVDCGAGSRATQALTLFTAVCAHASVRRRICRVRKAAPNAGEAILFARSPARRRATCSWAEAADDQLSCGRT